MTAFNTTYPQLRTYAKRATALALQSGGVRTLAGRPRWLPALRSGGAPAARAYAERQVLNSIVQGSSSDIIKRAMLLVAARFRALALLVPTCLPLHSSAADVGASDNGRECSLWAQCGAVMQLHDEVIYEVPAALAERAAAEVRAAMEQVPALWQRAMAARRGASTAGATATTDASEAPALIAFPVKVKVGPRWGGMTALP